jgi:integrase
MQKINQLSPAKVEHATKAGRYGDGLGLYLEVSKGGGKSWVLLFKRNGRRRAMGLGSAQKISLKKARELAKDAHAAIAGGLDPIEQRKKHRAKAITFAEAAKQCHAQIGTEWRSERHRAQWLSSLDIHTKRLANKIVSEITVDDVEAVLRPLWTKKLELALRLRERIERVLGWCKVRKYRDGENPAAWKNNLKDSMPTVPKKRERVKHMRALDYVEIPAFMAKLRAIDDRLPRDRALEFTILTAARSGEVFWATWDEIDFAERLWTIPQERMKNNKPHVVPLSDRAMEILQAQYDTRSSRFVFPGHRNNRPMSNTQMLTLMRRMGVDVQVHGFRSAFRDWCGDKMAGEFSRDLFEFALAHTVGNATEEAYRRKSGVELRRKLMDTWAKYCGPPRADNVIPMERTKGIPAA